MNMQATLLKFGKLECQKTFYSEEDTVQTQAAEKKNTNIHTTSLQNIIGRFSELVEP